jgi:hydroxypyruvate reductase
VVQIARAGIAAASAGPLVHRALAGLSSLHQSSGPIDLLAAGKAAVPMTIAAASSLGPRVRHSLVASPDSGPSLPDRIEHVRAAHPVPDAGSMWAGRRAIQIAEYARPEGWLIVLLSGGASSLLACPAEDLTLDDKMDVTRLLLASGLTIHEMNTVRKHLSAVKGGYLALRSPGPVLTLAVSDVVGAGRDTPSVIGSGPTVPDPSTFHDALAVIDRGGLADALPARARARLERGARGAVPETPKPGDPRLAHSMFHLVGGLADALAGAERTAEGLGYRTFSTPEPVTGEAREAARRRVQVIEQLATRHERPLCLVSGGETTVRVVGQGRGGRNLEFALALVEGLEKLAPAVAISVGTDGVDGPTDAAGALVDSKTLSRAALLGLERPDVHLADNDAYPYFERLGDLVRTGATETNVGDLQVVILG